MEYPQFEKCQQCQIRPSTIICYDCDQNQKQCYICETDLHQIQNFSDHTNKQIISHSKTIENFSSKKAKTTHSYHNSTMSNNSVPILKNDTSNNNTPINKNNQNLNDFNNQNQIYFQEEQIHRHSSPTRSKQYFATSSQESLDSYKIFQHQKNYQQNISEQQNNSINDSSSPNIQNIKQLSIHSQQQQNQQQMQQEQAIYIEQEQQNQNDQKLFGKKPQMNQVQIFSPPTQKQNFFNQNSQNNSNSQNFEQKNSDQKNNFQEFQQENKINNNNYMNNNCQKNQQLQQNEQNYKIQQDKFVLHKKTESLAYHEQILLKQKQIFENQQLQSKQDFLDAQIQEQDYENNQQIQEIKEQQQKLEYLKNKSYNSQKSSVHKDQQKTINSQQEYNKNSQLFSKRYATENLKEEKQIEQQEIIHEIEPNPIYNSFKKSRQSMSPSKIQKQLVKQKLENVFSNEEDNQSQQLQEKQQKNLDLPQNLKDIHQRSVEKGYEQNLQKQRNEILELKKQLNQEKLSSKIAISNLKESYEQQINSFYAQIDQKNSIMDNLQKQLDNEKQSKQKQIDELKLKFKSDTEKLKLQIQKEEFLYAEDQQETQTLLERIKVHEKTSAQAKNEIQNLKTMLEKNNNTINILENNIKDYQEQIEKLQQNQEKLKFLAKESRDKYSAAENDYIQIRIQNDKIVHENEFLWKENQKLEVLVYGHSRTYQNMQQTKKNMGNNNNKSKKSKNLSQQQQQVKQLFKQYEQEKENYYQNKNSLNKNNQNISKQYSNSNLNKFYNLQKQ